jgi:hypothetical protein
MQITNTAANLHFALTVIDANTNKSYEHAQLIRSNNKTDWIYSTANEFDRLTEGIKPHILSGSETMRYIHHHAPPLDGRPPTPALLPHNFPTNPKPNASTSWLAET